MKKWCGRLKESDNYNILIPAMLTALSVIFIWYAFIAGGSVYNVIRWGQTEWYLTLGLSVLPVVFVAAAVYFVIQACNREPKFMICAVVCLAVFVVAGVSWIGILCMLAGMLWLFVIRTSESKGFVMVTKGAAIILVVMTVIHYGMLFCFAFFCEWGTSSIEEGDWSRWETEETLNDPEWESDEPVEEIYYDEDGNGSTSVTFEFE